MSSSSSDEDAQYEDEDVPPPIKKHKMGKLSINIILKNYYNFFFKF